MLLIKYTKKDNAKYIPHVDMLRQISRILRRAGISVKFSQGFNPHELIYFAPPIPLCMSSTAEYCAISTEEKASSFIEKFNSVSIEGITCVNVVEVEKNPNIAGKAVGAKYKVICNDQNFESLKQAFNKDSYQITYSHKGEQITKEVRPLMFSLTKGEGFAEVELAHGNVNLRADRFFDSLGISICDVEKIEEQIEVDGKRVSCDVLFE